MIRTGVAAGLLVLALLPLADCKRGEAGATLATAPPLECPPTAHVQRVQFAEDRGGGSGERCILSDGRTRHGPSRDWNPDGGRRAVTYWWQGFHQGKGTFWYPNGQKEREFHHYRDQPTGVWLVWNEKGELTEQKDFGPPDPKKGTWPMPQLGEPPGEAGSAAPPAAAPGVSPAAAPESATPAAQAVPDAPPSAASGAGAEPAAEQPGKGQ